MQFIRAVFPRNEGIAGCMVFECAGEGGDDLAAWTSDDSYFVFGVAVFIEADVAVAAEGALLIEAATNGCGWTISSIPDELEDAVYWYVKLTCCRMTVDFIIMPLNDVGQCCGCEIIGFTEVFFLIGDGKTGEQFFVHFIDPCLCIGKEENEFDPLFFVKVHCIVFRVDAFLYLQLCDDDLIFLIMNGYKLTSSKTCMR